MANEAEPLLVMAFQSTHQANGGVASLLQLLGNLKQFHPVWVTQRSSAVAERWAALGGELEIWPIPTPATETRKISHWERLRHMARSNFRVYRKLKQTGIQVVHCNDLYALMHAGLGARLAGAGVLHNIRGTFGVRGLKWSLARIIANRVVVLSEEMSALVEENTRLPRWVPRTLIAPVCAIYSIVDFETMRPLEPVAREEQRLRLGMLPGEFSVGIVGAVVLKKQQLEFIRALKTHRVALPAAARFWFIGDFSPESDEYAAECRREVADSELGGIVRFVGYSENVSEWYQSLDCVLCVSAHEGLARAMIESLACGTGVISFDVASAREILEKHGCGTVSKQGDYSDLLASVSQAAAAPEAFKALGRKGQVLARELFAEAKSASAYEQVYVDLKRGRPRIAHLNRPRKSSIVFRSPSLSGRDGTKSMRR